MCGWVLQVYSSTVVPNVRSRCLSTIVKLIAVGSPAQLETVLADLPISSFVASLLGGRDVKAQAAAIQMAEILMAKLPNIFTGTSCSHCGLHQCNERRPAQFPLQL
jgi:E3 ubiquitin-protein ligase TRIP12